MQAARHPADHARLGVAEQRLDELCGIPGLFDEIARSVMLDSRVKGAARRAMTPALAIRFTLLMTLIPDADYPGCWKLFWGLDPGAVAAALRDAGRDPGTDVGLDLATGVVHIARERSYRGDARRPSCPRSAGWPT